MLKGKRAPSPPPPYDQRSHVRRPPAATRFWMSALPATWIGHWALAGARPRRRVPAWDARAQARAPLQPCPRPIAHGPASKLGMVREDSAGRVADMVESSEEQAGSRGRRQPGDHPPSPGWWGIGPLSHCASSSASGGIDRTLLSLVASVTTVFPPFSWKRSYIYIQRLVAPLSVPGFCYV